MHSRHNMERYMKSQDFLIQTLQNIHTQAKTRLEVQMSQLANLQNERQKGTLPSQSIMNPKSSHGHLAEDQSLNQCNVVHALRSEMKVDNQVSTSSKPIQHNHIQASTSSSLSPFKSDKSKTDKSASQVH